jgi:tRNA 5-methylaminomethyl-2-thiouridine biosynthesis bifunctional protein
VIVGAGLAGCALACTLAEQGRSSIILERAAAIASEGSGNTAGLFHGVVHRDDGRHARFNRAAALEAHRQIATAIAAHGVDGGIDGLLRLEGEGEGEGTAEMQTTLDRLGLPGNYVCALTADEASKLAGTAIASAAWFYPGGGWVDPRGLARSYLERAGSCVELRLQSEVATLQRGTDERWRVLDAIGNELASSMTVVLANGGDAASLLGADDWPIERQRGQISAAPAALWPAPTLPRLPIAGSGYVLPAFEGRVWFGATSRVDDGRTAPGVEDHAANVARLGALLANRPDLDPGQLLGRVSFRYLAHDRLPLVGAMPLTWLGPALKGRFAPGHSPRPDQPRFAPRAPGLFLFTALGSRGIAWSALGAQVLAAMMCAAPVPLEADLLDAIDPARFDSRSFRRSGSASPEGDQEPEGPIATGSTGA